MDAILYFDGRCTGNGTPSARAGFGWALQVDGEEVANGNGMVDQAAESTVNVAEYAGLVVGLRAVVRDYPDLTALKIRGDSKLVISQMTLQWGCGAAHLREYKREADVLIGVLEAWDCEVGFQWIPRDLNERADDLARAAFENEAE